MGKLLDLLKVIDFKTAGWKTYLGLALVVLALVLKHFAGIDEETTTYLIAAGVGLATVGKVAADKRKASEQEVQS